MSKGSFVMLPLSENFKQPTIILYNASVHQGQGKFTHYDFLSQYSQKTRLDLAWIRRISASSFLMPYLLPPGN